VKNAALEVENAQDQVAAVRTRRLPTFSVNLELQQAQAKALAQRPEIRQARLKVTQAEADRRSKKAEYIPEVSLTFSHLSPISYSNILPNHIASAGIAVNWEVFDWGRKKHELAAKERSVEQAGNAVNETESLVVREVNAIDALLEAGITRLRPVLITVGATVIALFPLASHGGPLWEEMCYAQIGGDLKLVKWTER
jgi:outer membrane protein TolC